MVNSAKDVQEIKQILLLIIIEGSNEIYLLNTTFWKPLNLHEPFWNVQDPGIGYLSDSQDPKYTLFCRKIALLQFTCFKASEHPPRPLKQIELTLDRF